MCFPPVVLSPQVRWLRCGGQSARPCGRCVRPTPCPCRCTGTTTSTTSGGTLEAGFRASTRPGRDTRPASSASPTPVGKLCWRFKAPQIDLWYNAVFVRVLVPELVMNDSLFVSQLAAVGRPGPPAPSGLMWSVVWSSTINWACGRPPKAQCTIIKVLLAGLSVCCLIPTHTV